MPPVAQRSLIRNSRANVENSHVGYRGVAYARDLKALACIKSNNPGAFKRSEGPAINLLVHQINLVTSNNYCKIPMFSLSESTYK